MTIGDAVEFLTGRRTDHILKPIICGDPAATIWLKLIFDDMRPGQVVEATVAETLFHPERGYAIYTEGAKLAFLYKDLRVAKKY